MNNPMLHQLSQTTRAMPQQQLGNNPLQMMQEFAKFKKQMAGKNPQQIVENLIKSGQMTNEQYQQLVQQAKSLQSILK